MMTLDRQPLNSILADGMVHFSPFRFAQFALALIPVAASAQHFTDLFTGSALDTTRWKVIPAFSDSSVVQSAGALTLNNRGKVMSVESFTGNIDATFKFQFTGSSHDQLRFVTRTDGVSTNGSKEYDRAVKFSVQPGTVNNVTLSWDNYPFAGSTLAVGSYPIFVNRAYTMRAVDDGVNLSLYLDNTNTPVLRSVNSASLGKQIGFTNREGAGAGSFISAGSQVKITAFTMNGISVVTNTVTIAVPDTSGRLVNLSTLGTGGFTMGFVVSGSSPKTMLVRAVGPSLTAFGVTGAATQTTLTLRNGSAVIAENSRWGLSSNAGQIAAFRGAFALPGNSADAAIMMNLSPGSYTAQSASDGAVLLEVYEVP